MQRIKLTKAEKRVLKHLSLYGYDALCDFAQSDVDYCLDILEKKGLVKTHRVEGGEIENAQLTRLCKSYMRCNPKLKNPISWDRIIALATMITLFSACVLIA